MRKAPVCPALYIGLAADTKPPTQANRKAVIPTSVDNTTPDKALLFASDTTTWYQYSAGDQLWLQLKAAPV